MTPLPESAVAVSDPLVGATVGSFRIVRQLGRGGMGTVYLAEHPVIGSKVAIKFLHEAMASSAEIVGRFYDEAKAVNLIGHENIVGIFDLSVLPPARYYIVMEYLEGETLAALVRRGPVEPKAAIDILLQLCDALHCAHGRGVVHRDLKPDNVFLLKRRGKAHFVKLVDFGIAKLRDAPTGSHTAAGMIVGTPEYMAPEQCDNRSIDARTDVYALGVMAYEIAAGRLPFSGHSIAQLLLAHLNEPPPPPRRVNPALHPQLEAAILRALEKDPEARWSDMAAFGDALTAALDAMSAAALSPTLVTAGAAPHTAAPAPATAPATPRAAPAGLDVEVRTAPDGPFRRLVATDVSRGGMYVAAEGKLPALFSRLAVRIPRPAPERPLELQGEVVRQVTAADAAAWGMSAGFALQFSGLGPELRAALARIVEPAAGGGGAPSTPPPGDGAGGVAAALLEALRSRASGTHYELLGVPTDADFVDVRSRAKSLAADLEAIRRKPLAADQVAAASDLLGRVERASAILGTPAERLGYDARRGNHLGVARCIAAGVPAAVLEARRLEFLAERPGSEERAQKHLVRAKVARAMHNDAVALSEYEAALAADPLHLAIHQAYWDLKRKGEAAR